MGKKPAKKSGKAGGMSMAADAGAKGAGGTRLVMTVGLIALIPFSIPTLILMFAGLLPTLVAALTDRSAARYAWICVGGMNFAGLTPALLKLWFGHHEISYALYQVTDFRVLLLAYLAASVGWLIYFGAPPVVITVMMATSKRRAAALQQQMKLLEAEWGGEVASRDMMGADDLT